MCVGTFLVAAWVIGRLIIHPWESPLTLRCSTYTWDSSASPRMCCAQKDWLLPLSFPPAWCRVSMVTPPAVTVVAVRSGNKEEKKKERKREGWEREQDEHICRSCVTEASRSGQTCGAAARLWPPWWENRFARFTSCELLVSPADAIYAVSSAADHRRSGLRAYTSQDRVVSRV